MCYLTLVLVILKFVNNKKFATDNETFVARPIMKKHLLPTIDNINVNIDDIIDQVSSSNRIEKKKKKKYHNKSILKK